MEKAIINLEVKNDADIYQIVNFLIREFPELKDLVVSYKNKTWILKNPEKVKYFLKEKYFDFEQKKEVKVKEI